MKNSFPSSDGYDTFPLRTDIEILPADDPNLRKIGLKITESIGIGIFNTRGIRGFSKRSKYSFRYRRK